MIDIYPDPADNDINIYFHADLINIKLKLTDMDGNEVFCDSIKNICDDIYKINTKNLLSGTYIINMEMPGSQKAILLELYIDDNIKFVPTWKFVVKIILLKQ